jgi:cell division protein FtsW
MSGASERIARRPPGVASAPRARTRRHLELVARPTGRRSGHFVALFCIVTVLSLIGVVMVLSASAAASLKATGSSWYSFKRHVMWLSLGFVAMVVTIRVDYRRWRAWAWPVLLASLGAMVAVLIPGIGVSRNGAQRWLGFGSFTVQPAELAKLALVLFVADFLARPERPASDPRVSFRPVLVLVGVMATLLLAQPNLGTTIVIAGLAFAMTFAAGVPGMSLLKTGGAASGLAVIFAVFADYRRERLLGFLDPWKRRSDQGAQTIQSITSIVSGRVTGVGLGNSRGKWGYLPFAHTDFIFSIVAEELGLIGAVTVIGLFVALGFVGFAVALHAPDRFGMLLATGITVWLVMQGFINIAVTLGLLPVTGLPLPFLSFGGSSLVVTLAASGMLMSIARHARS